MKTKSHYVWINLGFEDTRTRVLHHVINKMGFDFPIMESDFSPQHRKEIAKLVPLLEKYDSVSAKFGAKTQEIKASQPLGFKWIIFALGVMVLIFGPMLLMESLGFQIITDPAAREYGVGPALILSIAVLLLILSLIMIVGQIWMRTLGGKRLRQRQRERDMYAREANELWADYMAKVEDLASSIKDYVLTVARTRVDFGRLLIALKEKGVILKTIECPNCSGILKISEVPQKEEVLQCKYCGKSILAINLFEKFKDVLGF